jgi:hypothetical protein
MPHSFYFGRASAAAQVSESTKMVGVFHNFFSERNSFGGMFFSKFLVFLWVDFAEK